ncbi:hypothetical protein [Belnapia moabensis]|uniref:hypothetical protein n=1 Tax=Belnapia moabensis TaxID=365533 RepID=UPI0012ED46A8|nr:hypothetical protein [Belnapia moabensis]
MPFDIEGFAATGRSIAETIKAALPGWHIQYHDYSKAVCACCEAVEEVAPT